MTRPTRRFVLWSALATATVACGHDATGPQPLDPAQLLGTTYTVTLTSAGTAANPGVTCSTVKIFFSGYGPIWNPIQCTGEVLSAMGYVRNDTLVLEANSGLTEPIVFTNLRGNRANPQSDWSGATCVNVVSTSDPCVREKGTAAWTHI